MGASTDQLREELNQQRTEAERKAAALEARARHLGRRALPVALAAAGGGAAALAAVGTVLFARRRQPPRRGGEQLRALRRALSRRRPAMRVRVSRSR
jgi:hypothetical protein